MLMYPSTNCGYLVMKQEEQMLPKECAQRTTLPTFRCRISLMSRRAKCQAVPSQVPRRSSSPSKPGMVRLTHLQLLPISFSSPAHSTWSPGAPCSVKTVCLWLSLLSVMLQYHPSPSSTLYFRLARYKVFFFSVSSMPKAFKFLSTSCSTSRCCLQRYFQGLSSMIWWYSFSEQLLIFLILQYDVTFHCRLTSSSKWRSDSVHKTVLGVLEGEECLQGVGNGVCLGL